MDERTTEVLLECAKAKREGIEELERKIEEQILRHDYAAVFRVIVDHEKSSAPVNAALGRLIRATGQSAARKEGGA